MTAVPRPSLAGARRPQIVAAAARAIAEHGFDGVRLVDVAREAGVSVGTLQHYFGSRQALVEATFRQFNEQAAERLRAVVADAGTDPWDGLVALVEHVVAPDMRWNLWAELASAAMRRPGARAHHERGLPRLARAGRRGRRGGRRGGRRSASGGRSTTSSTGSSG